MTNINELTAKLKAAAQEEIMCRESCDTSDLWQDEASPENVLALLNELEAAEELNKHLDLAVRKAEGVSEALRARLERAELEARTLTVKPVAWMRNTNVTSFMSRFTTDESYAVAQWGSDAIALYSLPVAFIPACFTDERNLMHINERARETSLIWSEHNSESGDIKLFRIAAGIKLQNEGEE